MLLRKGDSAAGEGLMAMPLSMELESLDFEAAAPGMRNSCPWSWTTRGRAMPEPYLCCSVDRRKEKDLRIGEARLGPRGEERGA